VAGFHPSARGQRQVRSLDVPCRCTCDIGAPNTTATLPFLNCSAPLIIDADPALLWECVAANRKTRRSFWTKYRCSTNLTSYTRSLWHTSCSPVLSTTHPPRRPPGRRKEARTLCAPRPLVTSASPGSARPISASGRRVRADHRLERAGVPALVGHPSMTGR